MTGIDLTGSMLDKARDRVAREGIKNVRLLEMDAADLKFADGTFDIVYAPYLISVVPDPVSVAREMSRVCRSGGRVIFLNHFRSANPILAFFERLISPFTVHIGFKSDLDLTGLPCADRYQARLDRKGERPEDLVAYHLHQRLVVAQAPWSASCPSLAGYRRRR